MYKIYVNETPVFLTDKENAEMFAQKKGNHLVARYAGQRKILLSYVDMLEKNRSFDSVVLYSDDVEQLYRDFTSYFLVVEAAGGLVFNEEGALLMIFRKGHWDLPKGKMDEGETIEEAAVREVEEETGVGQIQLKGFFQKTYHFYREKDNKRAIKLSHWYLMKAPKQPLTPQIEEDIQEAIWIKIDDFLAQDVPVYKNVLDLLHQYQRK